jgi:hypothetical protein
MPSRANNKGVAKARAVTSSPETSEEVDDDDVSNDGDTHEEESRQEHKQQPHRKVARKGIRSSPRLAMKQMARRGSGSQASNSSPGSKDEGTDQDSHQPLLDVKRRKKVSKKRVTKSSSRSKISNKKLSRSNDALDDAAAGDVAGKKKKKKGKNWTALENLMLARAYVNASANSVKGSYQSAATLWNTVFVRMEQFWAKRELYALESDLSNSNNDSSFAERGRTANDLKNHWKRVIGQVRQFHAIFEMMDQSGTNEELKYAKAEEEYFEFMAEKPSAQYEKGKGDDGKLHFPYRRVWALLLSTEETKQKHLVSKESQSKNSTLGTYTDIPSEEEAEEMNNTAIAEDDRTEDDLNHVHGTNDDDDDDSMNKKPPAKPNAGSSSRTTGKKRIPVNNSSRINVNVPRPTGSKKAKAKEREKRMNKVSDAVQSTRDSRTGEMKGNVVEAAIGAFSQVGSEMSAMRSLLAYQQQQLSAPTFSDDPRNDVAMMQFLTEEEKTEFARSFVARRKAQNEFIREELHAKTLSLRSLTGQHDNQFASPDVAVALESAFENSVARTPAQAAVNEELVNDKDDDEEFVNDKELVNDKDDEEDDDCEPKHIEEC